VKIALVLGAGGVTGMAYHAAALAAIENDLGWDPRRADLIVGTSAGSVVGTLLRRGLSALDLAAVSVGGSAEDVPPELLTYLTNPPELPSVGPSNFLRVPRLPDRQLIARSLLRAWRIDPVEALVAMLPDGRLNLRDYVDDLDQVLGGGWPDDDLWLCALRQRDHRRVVFGRDGFPSLADAVAASCCVPAFFAPVEIDGASYLDGGVRSPTNADLVRRRDDIDLAIIVSPMSGRHLRRPGMSNAMRRHAGSKLRFEREILRRAAIPSIVIEPDAPVIDAFGTDFMSSDNVSEIITRAFFDTAEQLRSPYARELLDGLASDARPTAA
jgi:NTE family protein